MTASKHSIKITCVRNDILVKRGFDLSIFEPRHMLREQVEVFLHVWTPINNEVIDSLIGYNPEEINDTDGVGD